ncbi:MAG: EAL domain-containing response regulator [Vicinamibacteria bacterium]|nr:EAL domain-containing response regulator [Vicinamibacteria bacterium]
MPEPTPHVLLVDDDPQLVAATRELLEDQGYRVSTAADGEAAIRELAVGGHDLVLTDVSMPGLGGVEVLKAVRARDRELPVVFLTGSPSLETAIDAVQLGARHYLLKPVAAAELLSTVADAVAEGRRRRLLLRRPAAAAQVEGLDTALPAAFDRALASVWVAWQPLFRADGSLFAHEALLRSHEPALVRPQQLLAAAERLGRLPELCASVRGRAAADERAFASGLVFVNLTPADLLDSALLKEGAFVARAGSIVLEITEQAPLHAGTDLRARLEELRAAGFRIALDDLGAGHSNLNSFTAVEPDFVKLDMALIRDIDREPVKRRLVRAMVETCHDLGIAVVAEGLERPGERAVVVELGCDLLQGFLLARPAAVPLAG